MNARLRERGAVTPWAWFACLPGAALADAAEDIRDIRGPKALQAPWVVYAIVAGAILVVLGIWVYWRWRKRPVRRRAPSLSEQMLQRLDSTRALMHPDTARAFGIAASEVIRDYIEKRFAVVATQRTTEEFLQSLVQNSNETLARYRSLLAQFLQQCDYVKFAGDSLAVADMESLFQSARRFVLEHGEAPVA